MDLRGLNESAASGRRIPAASCTIAFVLRFVEQRTIALATDRNFAAAGC